MFLHRNYAARGEGGQGLVEYAFILVLVALIVLGSLSVVGQEIVDEFCYLSYRLSETVDLSSPCSEPIVRLGPVEQGPNYLNLEVGVYDPDRDPDHPYAAISKVEFYIDGIAAGPVQTEKFHRYCMGGNAGLDPCNNYNIGGLSPGSHTVIVLAYDTDGNVGDLKYRFTK